MISGTAGAVRWFNAGMNAARCRVSASSNDMAALIIRLPDGKRERLKDLARARRQSVTKLFEEMATVMLAEYDAETRFRARAARGAGKTRRGLQLLAKARGERRARRAG